MNNFIQNGLPTRNRTWSYPLGGDCFILLSDEEKEVEVGF